MMNNAPNLHTLTIESSACKLTHRCPPNLKVLTACLDSDEGSQVAEVPETLEYVSVFIRGDGENITDVDEMFGRCTRMKVLDLTLVDAMGLCEMASKMHRLRVLDVYVDFMGDFTDVACELKQLEVLKIDTTDGVLISKTGDYVDLTRCTNLKIFGLFTDEEEVSFRTMRLPPSLEVMHVGEYPFEFPNGVPQLKALTMMWHVETPISQDTWCSMWGSYLGFSFLNSYLGFSFLNKE